MAILIWLNILVWDLTFMGLYTPFSFRLSFYLLLTFLILWHSRESIKAAVSLFLSAGPPKFKYPLWLYLLLPVCAACLEIMSVLPSAIVQLIKQIIR